METLWAWSVCKVKLTQEDVVDVGHKAQCERNHNNVMSCKVCGYRRGVQRVESQFSFTDENGHKEACGYFFSFFIST